MKRVQVRVVNKRYYNDCIYIGRGTPLCNPFPITDTNSRDDVCDQYEKWFNNNIRGNEEVKVFLHRILESAKAKGYVNLGCHCTPKRCHGLTIKKWLDNELQLIADNFRGGKSMNTHTDKGNR